MSITIKFAVLTLGAVALGVVASPVPSNAGPGCSHHHATPCAGPVYVPTRHCYYLPTAANGRVTGVRKVCN